MKRVLATIVSALVTLAFAGLVSAQQQPYGTETHPPIIQEQPGMKADTGKTVKKAKKKKKKAKKAKKEMKQDMGTMGTPETAPNATVPSTTEPPPQPVPAR